MTTSCFYLTTRSSKSVKSGRLIHVSEHLEIPAYFWENLAKAASSRCLVIFLEIYPCNIAQFECGIHARLMEIISAEDDLKKWVETSVQWTCMMPRKKSFWTFFRKTRRTVGLSRDLPQIQYFVLTVFLGTLYCGGCRVDDLVEVLAITAANRYIITGCVTPNEVH